MDFAHFLRSATACALAAALLPPSALAAPSAATGADSSDAAVSAVTLTDSANVISAALNEVGYVEGAREYTKYGEWYGLPNAFWCDMFVSWCAMQGGVPESQFPRQCSCTSHVGLFTEMGRYQISAARGGNYIPQQGDVIFFYNDLRYPTGKVCSHTGLVLYVEDGYVYTIEGNALTNRLDYLYTEVSAEIDGALDPPDRVVVNRYPLNAPHIHGYGIPAYESRTPLALEGYVDLGQHSGSADIFQRVVSAGVMPATSSHTFSPNHGMTRGDFLTLVMNFFNFPDGSPLAPLFDDVPADSPYFAAAMSARAAGLVSGTDENKFQPDIYISPSDAQVIFDRALERLGLEPVQFSFSGGDYSYLLTPYTIRADIAKAFDTLCGLMPLSEAFDGQILLGDAVTCSGRNLDGVCYVPVQSLLEAFPALELLDEPAEEPEELTDETDELPAEQETVPEETVSGQENEDVSPEEDLTDETPVQDEDTQVQGAVSEWGTGRVLPSAVTLLYGDEVLTANGFVYQGRPYVDVYTAAGFLSAELAFSEEAASEEFPEQMTTVVRLTV